MSKKSISPIIVSLIDENSNKVIPELCNISKNLYNSLLMFIFGSNNENKTDIVSIIEDYVNIDDNNSKINELINHATKLRNFKCLEKNIGKYTLAIILEQIYNLLQSIKDCSGKKKDITIMNLMKNQYNEIFIPKNNISKNIINGQIIIDLGNAFNNLYNIQNVQFPIPYIINLNVDDINGILITPDENSNTFIIEYILDMKKCKYNIKKYINIIDNFYKNVTTNDQQTIDKQERLYDFGILAVDLGSENFATCIDTRNFKPFIIEASYLFACHKYYIDYINSLNILKDSEIIFKADKKLKRWIKGFITKCIKYIIGYCLKNEITDIVIGVAGQRFNDDNFQQYNIGKYNFAPIIQGLLRYHLKIECEKYNINFHDIDEYQTSMFCCRCGHFNKKGRNRVKNLYTCTNCNLIAHGDINATINILKRYCNEYLLPEELRNEFLKHIDNSLDYDNLIQPCNIVRLIKKKLINNPFLDN